MQRFRELNARDAVTIRAVRSVLSATGTAVEQIRPYLYSRWKMRRSVGSIERLCRRLVLLGCAEEVRAGVYRQTGVPVPNKTPPRFLPTRRRVYNDPPADIARLEKQAAAYTLRELATRRGLRLALAYGVALELLPESPTAARVAAVMHRRHGVRASTRRIATILAALHARPTGNVFD